MYNTATQLEKMISDGRIVLVEASKLSLHDDFMKYKPITNKEQEFKQLLKKIIKKGVKDFYRPICDPGFTDNSRSEICYEFDKSPALGNSYLWWQRTAKEFMPNCRLGTRYEYISFLGVLIKKLVENGWTVEKAWRAVCFNSRELGYYNNIDNNYDCENTGSREICGFYDLANTNKILADDEENSGYWCAGGSYVDSSSEYPLAKITHEFGIYDGLVFGVAWLVFDLKRNHNR